MIVAAVVGIVLAALLGLPLFAAFSAAALLGQHAADIPFPVFMVEVYRMTSDGSFQTNLTHHAAADRAADWER